MKHLRNDELSRRIQSLKWMALCFALIWTTGCQSMIKSQSQKTKDALAQQKFSCGESMPGRIP